MYGSLESLDFVRDCLDELSVKSKYDSVDESNPILILPPTFIILARSPNNEDIIHHLRKEGQELCSRYGWPVLLRFLPYSIRPKFCCLLVVLVVLFAVSKIALLQLYVEKLLVNTTPEM